MHHFTEVTFDTSEENQLSHFQNGYFFKILWGYHEPYNHVKCRWRNEIFSECFTIKNHGHSFVSFYGIQSLDLWSCFEYACSIFWLLHLASLRLLHFNESIEYCKMHQENLEKHWLRKTWSNIRRYTISKTKFN